MNYLECSIGTSASCGEWRRLAPSLRGGGARHVEDPDSSPAKTLGVGTVLISHTNSHLGFI